MLPYIKGKEHGKLLVDSFLNGPFQYGTITEPSTATTPTIIRQRRYDELIRKEKIRESVDIKANNIVLQGLPQDIYNLVNHHDEAKAIWDRVPIIHQPPQESFPPLDSGLVVPLFLPTDDPISSLNKAMAFINRRVTVQIVQGRQTQAQGYAASGVRSNVIGTRVNRNGGITQAGQEKFVRCYNCQEEDHMARQCSKPKRPRNSTWFKEKAMLVEALESGVALDKEHMALLADNGDIVTTEALFEVPTTDTYQTYNEIDQSVQEMQYTEQPPFINESDIEITKQAFWLLISKPVSEIPPPPKPVLKGIPHELPPINLVKDRFNKMRSHVNEFENVVTVRTKVTGQNEGAWGFEHNRKAFEQDVKPFINSLKEYFHVFDHALFKELTEIKKVFTQMETEVAKCYVDRKCFEIEKKELLVENGCLL
ncbi:putative reverse transcriptase domain-containing protein [Tanacetum coccineum]